MSDTMMRQNFASAFCKMMYSSSCEILHEKIKSNPTDQEIIDWVDDLTDERIRINVDGTYLNHEKPTDILMNRTHYSLHKKTHLTKAVVYCFTSGFIAQVSTRVSSIMNHQSINRLIFALRPSTST